ncbi:hypothetical protein D9M68_900540 [compost metagenome]
MFARGGQVDVVGAGGGDQHQFQLGAGGEGLGVQRDFVADRHLYPLQALDHLFRAAQRVQGQFAE